MYLDNDFWDKKYVNGTTGWDLGLVSPPIKEYLDHIENKQLKILIPGAGRAHEAVYAFKNGFKNVFLCDFSKTAVKEFKNNHPDFPKNQIILGDFFEISETFDLIIEQTFFCAIDPLFRGKYARKMKQLIKPHGKLVGLLFANEFERNGPPFGGTKSEYLKIFYPYFNIVKMEDCHNSIPPRMGNELFFILTKK